MPTFSPPRGFPCPWTTQFFAKDLPAIPRSKPRVFAEFESYFQLDDRDLRVALKPGYVPFVLLQDIPGHYGWTPATGDEIWLSRTFIQELEAALPPQKVPRNPDRYAPSELEEKLLLILEATTLHELVHYYRKKSDAAVNLRSTKGRGFEEALAREFERKAYGSLPTVQSLGIEKYMPKTAKGASKE